MKIAEKFRIEVQELKNGEKLYLPQAFSYVDVMVYTALYFFGKKTPKINRDDIKWVYFKKDKDKIDLIFLSSNQKDCEPIKCHSEEEAIKIINLYKEQISEKEMKKIVSKTYIEIN